MRPEMRKMRCPFMRTMLSAPDAPPWNAAKQTMNVDDLIRFIRDEPPGPGSVHEVLRFLSIVNHGSGNRIQRVGELVKDSGGRISTQLAGSDGDHAGDSRIYHPETGEFDEEQFDRFTSFSDDGKTMDVAAIGRAIADAGKRHKGSPVTAVQSAAEFALLFILIGDQSGTLKISDMRRLYQDNQFSPSARENLRSRTSEQWLDLTMRITRAVSDEPMGMRTRHRNMKPDRLREIVEILFAPLLRKRNMTGAAGR